MSKIIQQLNIAYVYQKSSSFELWFNCYFIKISNWNQKWKWKYKVLKWLKFRI